MILSTRMQPMVRTASALIRGLGSCESWQSNIIEFQLISTYTCSVCIMLVKTLSSS